MAVRRRRDKGTRALPREITVIAFLPLHSLRETRREKHHVCICVYVILLLEFTKASSSRLYMARCKKMRVINSNLVSSRVRKYLINGIEFLQILESTELSPMELIVDPKNIQYKDKQIKCISIL